MFLFTPFIANKIFLSLTCCFFSINLFKKNILELGKTRNIIYKTSLYFILVNYECLSLGELCIMKH